MVYFAIGRMAPHFPANNVVGAEVLAGVPVGLQAGWFSLALRGMLPSILNSLDQTTHPITTKVFSTVGGDLQNDVNGSPGVGDAVVGIPVPKNNTEFYEDSRESVYGRVYDPTGSFIAGVATYIDLSFLSDTTYDPTSAWFTVRFGTTSGISAYDQSGAPIPATRIGLSCLLPGDRFVVGTDIDPTAGSSGFYALEGVFLEPSFPRPVTDLSRAAPAVVDAANATLTTDDIGPRDYGAFDGSGTLSSEDVRFYVRRLRRWHEAQNAVVTGLEPLRYAYEIRRGAVDMGATSVPTRDFVAMGSGTQLGAFDDLDVNINAGDVLRIIHPATGEITDTAEIQKVTGANTLKLARPGLTESIPANAVFEVYLEQAIVPHEQSNEQLFSLITEEVVVNRTVDRSSYSPDGGSVPTTDQFTDSDPAQIASVQEGDYLVIDPAGVLYTGTERGQRPEGDVSFPGRPEHTLGNAAPLDDNRGFYRVTGNTAGVLDVTGDSRFSDGNAFGGDSGAEYVVLPIVNGGAEDQQALRFTSAPVETSPGVFSYLARTGNNSIQPVAYKVIRPNPVFTKDTVELVLFMRERMLSWIEEISAVYGKGGDYYVFQKDNHISDVGTAGSALSGLGVLSNAVVTSLTGLTTATPFANTADCLSILDRRFWILDFRLDSLPKGASPTYSEFADDGRAQRPVLPDLIEEVLNLDDKLRDQRYAWISFRANREDGSIRAARRANGSLERRLRKQREAISRQKGLDKS